MSFVFILFIAVCSVAASHLSRYELPQYGSRRKLISPSGLYDEYGEVVVDDDGSYYYSPQESDAEVKKTICRRVLIFLLFVLIVVVVLVYQQDV